jgi:ABC-type iron transport system FetAB ATPase subunit
LDNYAQCLQENLTNDISLSLIGEFNIFDQTKFIVVHGPSGCGKKKFTELYCQKNFINLIVFYGYSMKKGLFEELIEFAMLSKKQTVIYFDNCQMWLGRDTINANNLFIGEFLNFISNRTLLENG